MKKITIIISVFIPLFLYSQVNTIENGVYSATNKGENIRLILKDNQYDLSIISGTFEITKDSIILDNSLKNASSFDLTFVYSQNKSDKIKINLKDNTYDLSSIYYANYKTGTPTTIYRRFSDVKVEDISDVKEFVYDKNLIFEIDRSDFLVLVKENYSLESEMSKFKIPVNVSEIVISVLNKTNKNIRLSGTYDKERKELTISNNKKEPLVFQFEGKNKIKKEVIDPFETLKINNWTYPGKETVETANSTYDAVNTAVDSAATAIPEPIKFELKVEKNYQEALKTITQTPNKFLVIYYDPKNKDIKSQFDEYIKTQNSDIQYNMYSGYDAQYDLYNYYLANKLDEKWFKKNKIKQFPCVVVVNSDGEILSQANKSIFDLKDQFNYYDDFNKKLKRTNALLNFKNSIAKKQLDSEIIKVFSELTALEVSYEDKEIIAEPVKLDEIKFVPPKIVKETIEEKQDDKIVDEIKGNPDSETVIEKVEESQVTETVSDEKPNFNTLTKVNFDKKQIQTTWSNLIQNHKNDANPNIDLTLVIIKELNNEGFTKQIFNEEKILDDANFLALDYIFKHFDAIEKARIKSTYNVDAIHNLDFLETEIGKILTSSVRLIKPETSFATQQKIVSCYKRLQAIDKNNNDLNVDYFQQLKDIAVKSNSETQYIQEYDAFFKETFEGKINVFEKLDDLFTNKNHTGIDYWSEFKTSYSNLSNEASWYVVEHSKNPETIKKAIKWSENSLIITQKNHYYLDTLAQLYYLNGDQEKAFATQQLAIDNNNLEPENVQNYKDTLTKMKNGTY
jgi:hypothetical protein